MGSEMCIRDSVWGLRCAGQRLRSGAFAPDCPVVIFVTAFGGSFRFPRAYRLPAHPRPPPRRAPVVGSLPSLGRVSFFRFSSPIEGVEDLAGPAPGRPRGRPLGAYASSCVVTCFASRVGDLGLCSALGRFWFGRLCGVVPCRPRGRPRGLGGVLRFMMPLRAGEERACGACLRPAARAAF